MKFNITYIRPKKRRFESGWVQSHKAYKDTILFTYREHGFSLSKVSDNKFIMSHPVEGVRVIRFKG